MDGSVRFHGLLLTFRRPDELAEHLQILASQTSPLDTLLVVDNDDDAEIRSLATAATHAATGDVDYLGVPGNPGPAGGIEAGILHILDRAGDDDWLVLLDDDDPPQRDDSFAELRRVLEHVRAGDPAVGGVGLWGARLRPSGRLRVATGTEAEPVHYLPGGSCAHYSLAALRAADRAEPALFFGFDDLDLGLSLGRAGWTLWSSGRARDHGLAHMVEGRRATTAVRDPDWRRYYSLRNLIAVLRRDRRWVGAVWMSLAAGIAKPALNLMRRPGPAWASLRMNLRALRDGWTGRLGKTIDPTA